MSSIPTSPASSAFPVTSATTAGGVTHIDLDFAAEISKGSGTIFVTDGAVQTVIDRVTGQPTLRVVGASFTKEIALGQVQVNGTHVLFDATGLPPGANLNVYMGAGTLLSGGKAWGAITLPGSASFSTPAAEAPAGLTATIAVEDKTLKAGADIKLTVTFSTAVATLDPAAISAEHAVLKDASPSADGRTWTLTLGAGDSVESLSNVLRLDMGLVVGADGARGSGTIASAPYAVDTVVDAWLLPYLGVNDEGASSEDGITNDDDQFVSGLLMGSLAPDEHIELSINGRIVDQALIQLFDAGDAWGWYYDPDEEAGEAPRFNEGENTVSARIVKADGHSSAVVTKTITIDTRAPEIVSAPASPVDLAKPIVISFDEAMYWDDIEEVTQDIEVVDAFGNTSWISLHDGLFSADRKTLTLNPGDHDLATGNTYAFHLPYGLTDLAGNEYAGPTIEFTTAGPYQDKAPPRLTEAYIVNGSGSYKEGDVLALRLRFSEKITLESGLVPKLYLSNGAFATYSGLSADGKEMMFSYTVAQGQDTDYLEVDNPAGVLSGHVRDLAGNVMQNEHIEFGYLGHADGSPALVEIDTSAPAAPGMAQLHAASDSGSVGDGITTDTRPRLTGSGAEPGARIAVYDGEVLVASGIAGADGKWEAVVSAALGLGTHGLRVTQQDRAGNLSAPSTALNLSIVSSDTTIPSAVKAVVLGDGSFRAGETISFHIEFDEAVQQVGASAPWLELSNGARATLVGISGNQAEFAYTVKAGDDRVEVAIVDKSSLAGSIADLAGNLLDAAHITFSGLYDSSGAAAVIEIDTQAAALSAPLLAAASDTGSSSGDGVTQDNTPTYTGSGAEAYATVVLFAGDLEIGRTVADSAGGWSVTVADANALVDGSYSISAQQIDAAGNAGAASPASRLVVDTVGPIVEGAASNAWLREFEIAFNEAIVFSPSGEFDLMQDATVKQSYQGGALLAGANWSIQVDEAGLASLLNFKIAMNGMFNMHMANGSIQDLAGNVAIIGSPDWEVYLPLTA